MRKNIVLDGRKLSALVLYRDTKPISAIIKSTPGYMVIRGTQSRGRCYPTLLDARNEVFHVVDADIVRWGYVTIASTGTEDGSVTP